MTAQALEQFAEENGFKFKKITRMPLEGDGTILKKVSRYARPPCTASLLLVLRSVLQGIQPSHQQ